ncbi:MAG: hypothetical protein OMM_10476 [Candidatus Magnetoglobus multicellularis str. Araruama]|uniref:Uncharacterized protein n=1 Tax=Candidatus Magnetoglobus multicellularis str. Araruama TaxID=890399 RepID=A0A1V1P0U7_9BACT|nr:MAG: hypothetical protein OMM_10476 [Candidatus Magnetoglobus multicellularis str. Araruama]
MSVIEFNIDDGYIQNIGIQAIQEFMERQLSLLNTQKISGKIIHAIQESGFDHRKELEESRSEAWSEYKSKYLTAC